MDRIIQICKYSLSLAALSINFFSFSGEAQASTKKNELETFTGAWLEDMAGNEAVAVQSYAQLMKRNPNITSFNDGLWKTAISTRDLPNALKAAKAKEVAGESLENSILLFSIAVKNKKWSDAKTSIAAIERGSDYDFLLPLLNAWLRHAQGQNASFDLDANSDILRYYANEQPAYFALARRDLVAAKKMIDADLGSISDQGAYLRLQAAPIFYANRDTAYATQLLNGIVPEPDFVQILKKNRPLSVDASTGLAAIYLRLGDGLIMQKAPDKALVMARIAHWLQPESDASALLAARARVEMLDVNLVDGELARVSAQSPYWTKAVSMRVEQYLKQDKASQALGLAQKLYDQDSSPAMRTLLAQTQVANGSKEAARDSYAALLEEAEAQKAPAGRRAQYAFLQATVEHDLGNWTRARSLLENALSLSPQNPYIMNYLGYNLLERNEDIETAFDMLRRAYRMEPDSTAIMDSLGWAYFQKGDYDQAVTYLEKAVRSSGSDMTINEHLGDAYWLSGRFYDARYAWKVAKLGAKEDDAKRIAGKIAVGIEPQASATSH